MMRSLYLAFALLFPLSCSLLKTSPEFYARNPIAKQLIRARNGRLSNLSSEGLISYDLEDSDVRKMLVSARFICNASGRRFRICPDKNGLCRNSDPVCSSKFLFFCTKHTMAQEFIEQGASFDSYRIECRSEFNPAPES